MSRQLDIKVPALGESITEATVVRWLKEVGDPVVVDETLAELETDKVTLEVSAPASGVLESIFSNKGSVVKIGDVIGFLQEAEGAADVPDQAPSVRKLLSDHNLDPAVVTATGKEGRLTKGDVLNHLENPPVGVSFPEEVAASKDERLEERVPMSRLRQRASERLKQAQNTAAILTTFNEVDMTAVMELRNLYKESFEKKHGVKLGFMSFFVKASLQALKEIPSMNSQIDGGEIVHKNYYDISIAISAPHGLIVPTLRNADQLNHAGIEKGIADLASKAKDSKLSVEDLSGGTFTISNGGIFGSLFSAPILNPPQSGILGMHKIQDRPVAINGRVEIRPMMYLALSYDHRLIDGREAVTFLVCIKECIENPGRFLLDL